MPFYDLVQQLFQPAEVQAIDAALEAFEKALADKKQNLTTRAVFIGGICFTVYL